MSWVNPTAESRTQRRAIKTRSAFGQPGSARHHRPAALPEQTDAGRCPDGPPKPPDYVPTLLCSRAAQPAKCLVTCPDRYARRLPGGKRQPAWSCCPLNRAGSRRLGRHRGGNRTGSYLFACGTERMLRRISAPRPGLSQNQLRLRGLAGLDCDPASALQDWLMKKQVRPWPLLLARRARRPRGGGVGGTTDKSVGQGSR